MPGSRSLKNKLRGGQKKGSQEAPDGALKPVGGSKDEFDGRANTAAGTKGKEPGGRWTPGYYESPGRGVGKNVNDLNE